MLADLNLAPLTSVRIAVDCMGGDHGAVVTLPACQAFLASHPQAELILVGSEAALLPTRGWPRCTQVIASEIVSMDDSIEVALRRKRDSSMRVAISQLKDGAHACVSAGNTGALMALARYLLAEQPYDCAGSAKCETLGIALLEAIHSDDPTALVGLPLIRTCRMIRAAGVRLL